DAVRALPDHLLLLLHRAGQIQVHLAGCDSDVPAMARLLEEVGRVQEGLRRNAASQRADAAQPRLALDDERRQAELRRADGGDVTARSGTDDGDVVGLGRAHAFFLRAAETISADGAGLRVRSLSGPGGLDLQRVDKTREVREQTHDAGDLDDLGVLEVLPK